MTRKFPQFGYNPVTGEWNDSQKSDFLWSNVNVSEAVPDVMSPMTWSRLWIYFNQIDPHRFPGDYPICGNICGRPYFNLSLITSLSHAVGMDARKQMLGDLIASTPAELDFPFIPFSPVVVILKVLPGMLEDRLHFRRDNRQISGFLAMIPDWCRTMLPQIWQCADASGLLSMWMESIKPIMLRSFRMMRSTVISLSGPATRLNRDLTALVGAAEANTLLSNLSGVSGDLESMGPLVGLAKVKDGRMSRDQYVQRYGHRGPHEVELSSPDLSDDPEWLEKRFADFARSAIDVEALLAKQRSEFSAAWQRFEARFPDKFETFRHRLEIVAAAAKNREASRSENIRLVRLFRQYLLQVGKVTGIGDNVFFLTLDEMVAFLAGDRLPLSCIDARRELYQRYCSLPPYPALIYGRFDPFLWAANPNRRSDFYDARQKGVAACSSTIKGFSGSVGCVEGTVRRIDRVEDGDQIQPCEILVTSVTNVGWTPLFPRLAAIVTDMGAPLSHAAIVAREMGIPAVVGCGNATMLLKTGDRVRVDGGRGTVEILTG